MLKFASARVLILKAYTNEVSCKATPMDPPSNNCSNNHCVNYLSQIINTVQQLGKKIHHSQYLLNNVVVKSVHPLEKSMFLINQSWEITRRYAFIQEESMLMLKLVVSYSDPANMSLSRYRNLTNAVYYTQKRPI